LDYYESGMDIGLSDDMYKSFIIYQGKMAREFEKMKKIFGLQFIDGNRPIEQVDADLQERIDGFLNRRDEAHADGRATAREDVQPERRDPRHAPRGISKVGRLAHNRGAEEGAKRLRTSFSVLPKTVQTGASRKALRLSFEEALQSSGQGARHRHHSGLDDATSDGRTNGRSSLTREAQGLRPPDRAPKGKEAKNAKTPSLDLRDLEDFDDGKRADRVESRLEGGSTRS